MTSEDKWYKRMSFGKISELYLVVVLKSNDSRCKYQVVCGFPKLDDDNRIVISLNGQKIPLLESNGHGEWTFSDGVVDIKNLYHVAGYEQVAPEDVNDDDTSVYVGKIKVFGLRSNPLPDEPGLYLDGYGDTWVLTDCEEWQKWDFSDGSYEPYSEREAIDFAPFTPAKAVEK